MKEIEFKDLEGQKYYPRPSFHIGAIIISSIEFNPAEEYGGVWELYAQGRTLVGVDTSQPEFNTVGKTGGDKNLQAHTHIIYGAGKGEAPVWIQGVNRFSYDVAPISYQGTWPIEIQSSGIGNSGNLQPYITVYYYRRIG